MKHVFSNKQEMIEQFAKAFEGVVNTRGFQVGDVTVVFNANRGTFWHLEHGTVDLHTVHVEYGVPVPSWLTEKLYLVFKNADLVWLEDHRQCFSCGIFSPISKKMHQKMAELGWEIKEHGVACFAPYQKGDTLVEVSSCPRLLPRLIKDPPSPLLNLEQVYDYHRQNIESLALYQELLEYGVWDI